MEDERFPVTDARVYLSHVRIRFDCRLQNSETSESDESPGMSPSLLVTDDGDDDGSATITIRFWDLVWRKLEIINYN